MISCGFVYNSSYLNIIDYRDNLATISQNIVIMFFGYRTGLILFKVHRLGMLYVIYGTRCAGCAIKHLVNDLKILSLSSANQVHPPLMYSLLDRVSELKEAQVGTVQPYSTGPAELSVPEPVVEVSCILMSSLVFGLCGTLLQLWHC